MYLQAVSVVCVRACGLVRQYWTTYRVIRPTTCYRLLRPTTFSSAPVSRWHRRGTLSEQLAVTRHASTGNCHAWAVHSVRWELAACVPTTAPSWRHKINEEKLSVNPTDTRNPAAHLTTANWSLLCASGRLVSMHGDTQVESSASPRRVVAMRQRYANRKSMSASEADDVEWTLRRHEIKYRPPDVSGAYKHRTHCIANVFYVHVHSASHLFLRATACT